MAVRTATPDDLDAVVRLTAENRRLLAEWDPAYWRTAPNADAFHAAYLAFVLASEEIVKRVLAKGDEVIGFAVSNKTTTFWFVDDVCLDRRFSWAAEGRALLSEIPERPALMTAPHLDRERIAAARDEGLVHTSSYRLIRLEPERRRFEPVAYDTVEIADPPDAPRHAFAPVMAGAAMIGTTDGYAVTSRSIQAPPIYDPGGTTAVIDRVVGNDRWAALRQAVSHAAQRGDVGAVLVVAPDDAALASLADELEASRPVDVLAWPDR